MKIVMHLDSSKLNKPITRNSEIYALSSGKSPFKKEQLITNISRSLVREWVDWSQMDPIATHSEMSASSLREQLREILEDLVKQDILAPVIQATE